MSLKASGLPTVGALLFGIIALGYLNLEISLENTLLYLILNILLLGIVPLILIIIIFVGEDKGIKFRDIPGAGFFGSALIFLSISNIFAGVYNGLAGLGPNSAVTVGNMGTFFTGIFLFFGAVSILFKTKGKSKFLGIGFLYGFSIIVSISVILLTYFDLFPEFFVVGVGPTLIRQIIVILSIIFMVSSGIIYYFVSTKQSNDFFYWASIVAGLISLSLISFFLAKIVGGPISWIGRVAQYLSMLYLIAFLIQMKRKK